MESFKQYTKKNGNFGKKIHQNFLGKKNQYDLGKIDPNFLLGNINY
jgi:hypothetical protein